MASASVLAVNAVTDPPVSSDTPASAPAVQTDPTMAAAPRNRFSITDLVGISGSIAAETAGVIGTGASAATGDAQSDATLAQAPILTVQELLDWVA